MENKIDQAKLDKIVILFRQPDTLSLWGIPYMMREGGQQPGDLWRARRDYVAPKPGWYGSKQIDLSDWVWLGQPGWWYDLSHADQELIKAFLAKHTGNIPGNPYEWSVLESGFDQWLLSV